MPKTRNVAAHPPPKLPEVVPLNMQEHRRVVVASPTCATERKTYCTLKGLEMGTLCACLNGYLQCAIGERVVFAKVLLRALQSLDGEVGDGFSLNANCSVSISNLQRLTGDKVFKLTIACTWANPWVSNSIFSEHEKNEITLWTKTLTLSRPNKLEVTTWPCSTSTC